MGWRLLHWLNPFAHLATAAGKVVADGWTAAMLAVWNCGLWLLTHVLALVDAFTTPDLSATGPGGQVYRYTFWIAGTLAVTMAALQLGVTAVRRDGRSLARVVLGTGQFVMVWAGWLVYAAAVLAACGGLTRALMRALLDVEVWAAWQPWDDFSTDDITDATVATVLGFLGVFLVFAAIGHLLVMLTRAAALLVLAATGPISAAGLLAEAGRAWFWKSLRWFHAAAFTPVLMVLVLGIGVQLTQGVTGAGTDRLDKAVATALPGVVLICIGCFAPLALFKLLAFVEPGTSSGSAMRAGLAAQGGVGGLLGGLAGGMAGGRAGGRSTGGAGATSGAASNTDQHGRSQAESSGEDATSGRFASGLAGLAGQVGGALGKLAGAGLGAVAAIGAKGATIGADLTTGMGVGHPAYIPDFASARRTGDNNKSSGTGNGGGPSDDDNPDVNGTGGADTGGADPGGGGTAGAVGGGPVRAPFDLPATGTHGAPTSGGGGKPPGGPPAGGAGGSGGAGGAAAGGAAAGAAAIPVVPV